MIPPAPVTIGPSPLKVFARVAIASVIATIGAAILVPFLALLNQSPWLWSHYRPIVACTAALLICFSVIAVLGAVVWARPRLEIGPDGFVSRGVLGYRARRWSDIEGDFTVVRSNLQSVVAYRLTDAAKASNRMKPTASLAGNDEAILTCGELAIDTRALADVLNLWKRAAPTNF
jgi:hypothetical protein